MHVHRVSDAIQPSHPLSFPSPPALNLSQHQGVSSSHLMTKVLEFQLQHLPTQWIFRTDFLLRLTALNLRSKEPSRVFSKHHSSKASILRWQLSLQSNSHIHTWLLENIYLTRWTFVGKVMSLLFNMLSRLVITFFPRSKHLLILWLQSPSAVILEPRKIKSATVPTVSPSICHEVMGPDAMIFLNVEL